LILLGGENGGREEGEGRGKKKERAERAERRREK
jgi:hypothetical protein